MNILSKLFKFAWSSLHILLPDKQKNCRGMK
jgi:hypothetical protein